MQFLLQHSAGRETEAPTLRAEKNEGMVNKGDHE